MTETHDAAIARFSEALLQPLADVGALLARAIDDLNAEVAQQKAELAETRNDLRALERVLHDRTDHLA